MIRQRERTARPLFSATVLILFLILTGGCRKEESNKIVLSSPGPPVAETARAVPRIRIAVGGMVTPKEGMAYYHDLLRYVQDKIGIKVEYVDRESYAEINSMLENGEIEAAFVCSGPYVEGHKEFGLELLVAPQVYGATKYYSYIIVAKHSPIRSFSGLRGKRFAFTDPLSNTGKLVPTYMLARMHETPDSFFGQYIFTGQHDKSIKAVAQGVVDAAAVDSLIWEYLNATKPDLTAKTRILEKSPPYAIPPLVVPRDLDKKLKEKLRSIFLNAHKDPKGRAILDKMKIDKFVVIDDKAYDSVREMQAWIESRHKTE
jgi:phosphonate transport system substrate-binding protein